MLALLALLHGSAAFASAPTEAELSAACAARELTACLTLEAAARDAWATATLDAHRRGAPVDEAADARQQLADWARSRACEAGEALMCLQDRFEDCGEDWQTCRTAFDHIGANPISFGNEVVLPLSNGRPGSRTGFFPNGAPWRLVRGALLLQDGPPIPLVDGDRVVLDATATDDAFSMILLTQQAPADTAQRQLSGVTPEINGDLLVVRGAGSGWKAHTVAAPNGWHWIDARLLTNGAVVGVVAEGSLLIAGAEESVATAFDRLPLGGPIKLSVRGAWVAANWTDENAVMRLRVQPDGSVAQHALFPGEGTVTANAAIDTNGVTWVATLENGLYRWDGNEPEAFEHPDPPVHLVADDAGGLLEATLRGEWQTRDRYGRLLLNRAPNAAGAATAAFTSSPRHNALWVERYGEAVLAQWAPLPPAPAWAHGLPPLDPAGEQAPAPSAPSAPGEPVPVTFVEHDGAPLWPALVEAQGRRVWTDPHGGVVLLRPSKSNATKAPGLSADQRHNLRVVLSEARSAATALVTRPDGTTTTLKVSLQPRGPVVVPDRTTLPVPDEGGWLVYQTSYPSADFQQVWTRRVASGVTRVPYLDHASTVTGLAWLGAHPQVAAGGRVGAGFAPSWLPAPTAAVRVEDATGHPLVGRVVPLTWRAYPVALDALRTDEHGVVQVPDFGDLPVYAVHATRVSPATTVLHERFSVTPLPTEGVPTGAARAAGFAGQWRSEDGAERWEITADQGALVVTRDGTPTAAALLLGASLRVEPSATLISGDFLFWQAGASLLYQGPEGVLTVLERVR